MKTILHSMKFGFLSICLTGLIAAMTLSTNVAHAQVRENLAPSSHGGVRMVPTRAYYIYYRASASHPWTLYGGYYNAAQAGQAMNWFRYYGYQVFYRYQ
jgi:hypothetical protein